jgi:glutathione S-transferase
MTANDLKFHHATASPKSAPRGIFPAKNGLTMPPLMVDPGKSEQHREPRRAINPRRLVPTLVRRMAARSVTRIVHP